MSKSLDQFKTSIYHMKTLWFDMSNPQNAKYAFLRSNCLCDIIYSKAKRLYNYAHFQRKHSTGEKLIKSTITPMCHWFIGWKWSRHFQTNWNKTVVMTYKCTALSIMTYANENVIRFALSELVQHITWLRTIDAWYISI